MRTRARTLAFLPVVAAAALALAACGSSTPDGATTPGGGDTAAGSQVSGEITVYAAASLKAAFDEISEAFQAANPDVTIAPIDYDGSSTLVTQIQGGAAVDVFASADQANMQKLIDAKLATGATPLFATNTLVIAVPKGNPKGIAALADLANPDLKVVLCAEGVPCGTASHKLLDLDGVSLTPVSEEQNVTAVLTKVESGEADAGMVYGTDAAGAAAQVDAIVPENADQVVNQYPITVLDGAKNSAAAQAFVDFVTGADGQAILAKYGFGKP